MFDNPLLPFQFLFMQHAFLIVLILAVPTAILSCFLVLKGWALMGDAVSHAVLPGIVIAYIVGAPLILGAFIAGLFTSVATGYLAQNSRVKQDTVMGVVFSGMFGLGIVLYTAITSDAHLDHILFGNMLGIDNHDLMTAGLISLVVTLALLLKWKDLLLHAFDPAQARVSALSVNVLHYGLLIILSMTIVATMSATGLILAIGLLIAPGAIAFLIARSFGQMVILAVVVNLIAMFAGVYISFFVDSAPAPTIILVLTAFFLAAFVFKSWHTRRLTGSVANFKMEKD